MPQSILMQLQIYPNLIMEMNLSTLKKIPDKKNKIKINRSSER